MAKYHRMSLFLISIIVIYFIAFAGLAKTNPSFETWFLAAFGSDELVSWINQIIFQVLPMLVSLFFGGIGGWLEVYRHRAFLKSSNDLENENSILIQQSLSPEAIDSFNRDNPEVALGMLMGLVGHFIVSSKFLVKLFYSNVPIERVEVNFTGTALAAIFFGYFARDILGVSKSVFNKNVEKFLQSKIDEKNSST